MEKMGGLIHYLPWTSVLFLIGCISISGLPPFNGCVSEWLTFQAFLLSPSLPSPLMKLLIPLGAALLALTAALSAACFVKAFGATFLGHWRGHHNPKIHEPGWSMRVGMVLAAICCLALGILPTVVIDWMDTVPQQLLGTKISTTAGAFGWIWLTPVASQRASYSGPLAFIIILSVIVITYLFLHVRSGSIRRGPLWDCGFEKINPRMQYSSTAFAMPVRRIFGYMFGIKERVRLNPNAQHRVVPGHLHYSLHIRDRFWTWLYKPLVNISFWVSRKVGMLQQGRIQAYLIYSFITILVLLIFVR
jgi:NADH:ubiquinone oxidoreductase subunit 5 (subunit L)/multisubunit Na+/H+ antiporter MnhA subunit